MRNCVYVLLLLIPVSMQAQSQPTTAQETCPIDIVRVWKANIGQYVERDAIAAEYVNTSGKNIVAIKFGALFFNALDEPAASYTNYMDADGLRWDAKRAAQGKGQRSTIGQWNLFSETVRNIDFYPLKIKFEDGTFWKDDGTYRCNAGVPVTCLDSLIHVELRISAFRRTRWACDSPGYYAVARCCTPVAS